MTSRFDRKDEQDREYGKTMLAVILFFTVTVLCWGLLIALS
jgi:hypothetical protein